MQGVKPYIISMFENMPAPGSAKLFLSGDRMHVFLDESGDLGWKFDKPYRMGGSSRYLTLAFLLVDEDTHKYPRRLIRRLRSKYGIPPSKEVKGSDLTSGQLIYFADKARQLSDNRPRIGYCSITVRKENVQNHIRNDPNKLYNFMINLCILDLIKDEPKVFITPDPRSMKVASGNSMIDYLQTQLWFVKGTETHLIRRPAESHTNLNLQFVDVIAHIVWSYHEDGVKDPYTIISPTISAKHLFFH